MLAACAAPLPAAAQPTIRLWPDVSPPCDGTLQACVDGAGPVDQIRIATNDPIAETISFAKPLVLVAQSGFQPVFASGGITATTSSSGDQTIRVEGLGFDASILSLQQASTGSATLRVAGNTFRNGGGIGVGANLPGVGPTSFEVSGNTLDGVGDSAITVNATAATVAGSISDNSIQTTPGSSYAITIDGNTTADVLRNRISGQSQGIGVMGGATVRIVDNLVLGPQVPPGPGHDGIDNLANVQDPNASIDYVDNLFFANTVADIAYTLNVPITIVVADPLYASASDFHLRARSPAIDAGDDASLPVDVTTDLDGSPRIQGSHVDVGAYEAPEPGPAADALASVAALVALRRARPAPRAVA